MVTLNRIYTKRGAKGETALGEGRRVPKHALRVAAEGHAIAAAAKTEIGGNDRYVALCRRHFFQRLREGEARQLSLSLPRK